jgi:formate C-acetyltransferase
MNEHRRDLTQEEKAFIERQIQDPALALVQRAALRLKLFLEHEQIIKHPGERIHAWRTIRSFPDIYAPGEREKLTTGCYVHEQGRVCNISSDWEGVLNGGLLPRREKTTPEGRTAIDAVIAYADRYEDEALSRAIRSGAKGYLEALNTFRILHFSLWASNVYHNTVGRFDQYMWPFLKADMEKGVTEDEALSLTEEFFLSFNRDSDLYIGMQQGDNGQSLMLGGCDVDGRSAVNTLTGICLKASLHNRRIDPKINLRVDKNTPLELYELGTQLTRQGLGFPQYANDDVIISALTDMGYALEDARNYVVAACWEFIIPGVAMDIPNIGAVSLAGVVHDVIRDELPACKTYQELEAKVRGAIAADAEKTCEGLAPLFLEPAPYQTVLMSDVTHDVSEGAKYNNYGFHGTGFATAVDQLAAVKRYVFDEKTLTHATLRQALDSNFEGNPGLGRMLREDAPKLGRDEECVHIADRLLADFADALEPLRNERGGCVRPGTGSAMYYLWHSKNLGATADGRRAGESLSANFSPSLTLRDAGPLSVISAMARPGLKRVMNGGPLTLELHDTVFKHPEGVTKVAQLVKAYIAMGGHQLQLNAVSREQMLDAQEHPEAHGNLIVRVWGWSGHFVQLDKGYQDQIIQRVSYNA